MWINRHCVCARNSIILSLSCRYFCSCTLRLLYQTQIYCIVHLIQFCETNLFGRWSVALSRDSSNDRMSKSGREWVMLLLLLGTQIFTMPSASYTLRWQFIQCFSSITIPFHFIYLRIMLKFVCRASCAKGQMKILCEPIRITIYYTCIHSIHVCTI